MLVLLHKKYIELSIKFQILHGTKKLLDFIRYVLIKTLLKN